MQIEHRLDFKKRSDFYQMLADAFMTYGAHVSDHPEARGRPYVLECPPYHIEIREETGERGGISWRLV